MGRRPIKTMLVAVTLSFHYSPASTAGRPQRFSLGDVTAAAGLRICCSRQTLRCIVGRRPSSKQSTGGTLHGGSPPFFFFFSLQAIKFLNLKLVCRDDELSRSPRPRRMESFRLRLEK